MFSSHVTLKSGGYIVINQTEALVAIDVNSGRSTREHNIEDTALRTNLEAADEVARQLRLRDLAGLIVVDFIDMEESRNNRSVERRMKDALKNDRARIQIGRISHFGLLEMSRQRIRTGVLEGSTVMCEHCAGAGMVRSTSSIALHVLRVLEDGLIQDASRNIIVRARGTVALYILNQKRSHLADLEARFGATVTVEADEHLTGMTYCAVERGDMATGIIQPPKLVPVISDPEVDEIEDEDDGDEEAGAIQESGSDAEADASGESGDVRRKRRRRRGRGRDRESSGIADDAPQPADDALAFVADMEAPRAQQVEGEDEQADVAAGAGDEDGSRGEGREGKRRRSRRGGRRARGERPRFDGEPQPEEAFADNDATLVEVPGVDQMHGADGGHDAHDEGKTAHEATHAVPDAPELAPVSTPVMEAEPAAVEPVAAPRAPEPVAEAAAPAEPEAPQAAAEPAPARKPEPVSSEVDPARPKRSGWWQRAKASLGS
jgi:ribonuclease E